MDIRNILKSDEYLTGILLALVIPLIVTCLVLPAGRLVQMSSNTLTFYDSGILLLCLIPNLLVMRYYIVKAQFEKTGKGILLITVILIVMFFIFIHSHPFNFPF